jgi:ABC-2 type transport system ATP-binding protein
LELIIDRITKQYANKIAVDRLSCSLKDGVYALLGSNGAGKTTLMRMLCGVLTPTSGEIKLNGLNTSDEEYRNLLGYLPQDFGYYPDFTAMEFLMYISSLKGLDKSSAKLRSTELLNLTSLSDVAKKKIKTFSGGMKQRLGIAQAMLNNPKLLILDEPTAGLDPKERVRFRNLISDLSKDRIIILSTHIVSDIEYIANKILVMKSGQLIHNDSLDEIIKIIEDKVWECSVSASEAENLSKIYTLINIRHEKNNTLLRLVSDKSPTTDAVKAKACLEDLYIYYFTEVEEDKRNGK